MTYFYTSYWKRREDQHLHLAGILAVGEKRLAAYFPKDKDEQDDWNEIAQKINEQPEFFSIVPPHVWLNRIAQQGNGLTEDYGGVSQLEAASMDEALEQAFEWADSLTLTGQEEVKLEPPNFYDFGSPLASILPDSLLRPSRASIAISRYVAVREYREGDILAFKEGMMEVIESVEIPVVAKEIRLVEEVVMGKAATD